MKIQIDEFEPVCKTLGDQIREINRKLKLLGRGPILGGTVDDERSPNKDTYDLVLNDYKQDNLGPYRATIDFGTMQIVKIH